MSDIQLRKPDTRLSHIQLHWFILSAILLHPKCHGHITVTTRPVTCACSFPLTVIMDPDDYVETSDVDEQSMHSIIPHTPPRKRIKVRNIAELHAFTESTTQARA